MASPAQRPRAAAPVSRRALLRALTLACAAPAFALVSACRRGGDDDDAPTAPADLQATTGPQPGPGTPPAPAETAEEPTSTPGATATMRGEATPTRPRSPTATRTATPARSTTTPFPSGPTVTLAPATATSVATAAATTAPVTGGTLRLLSISPAQVLNPYLAQNTPSLIAGRIALEPLFDFDADLNPILMLGAEWPTVGRGLLDPFGYWVIWRLRPGVRWHDGATFSAADVRFTWEYATSGVSVFQNAFSDVIANVEIIDPSAVRLVFKRPNPNWIDLFRGSRGVILPEHVFRPTMDSIYQQTEPANLLPVGTGPWTIVGNNPQEGWARFERFADYWDSSKPYCDEVAYLGGGSSDLHAQTVLRDGGAEWAGLLSILDPAMLREMARETAGELVFAPSSSIERLHINFADPRPAAGTASEPTVPHPLFSDLRVRRALALAIPREQIAAEIWDPSGRAETHLLSIPTAFQGPGVAAGPDLEAARALQAEAGVAGGELTLLTSAAGPTAPRTLTAQRIVAALGELGFTVTVREVDATLFFGPGIESADSLARFNADLMLYAHGGGSPYPLDWARRYRSDEIAEEENRWTGRNIARYNNPAFDALHDQAQQAVDPGLQQELWRRMMTLVEEDIVEIPIVQRLEVAAVSRRVSGWSLSGWAENPAFDLKNWRRAAG